MFTKLTNGTRQLLKELLNSENVPDLLQNKFKLANSVENILLRGMLKELKCQDIITISWGSGIPYICILTNNAYTYFEREKEYEQQLKQSNPTNIHINTLNANGSNIVLGDSVNSTYSIENSVRNIEDKIMNQGGEDKELLLELLNEVKEIVENFESTKQIPKSKSFINRLSGHLDKHGWFYAEIVSLLGTAALDIMSK